MRRFAWLVLAGAPALLGAQGFGIYEHGSCSMARAGTGVAAPCPDGSAIFFNPAGLAGLTGGHLSAGATLIVVTGGFTDDVFGQETDLDNDPIPVPHLYVAYGLSSRLGVGVGVFAPYGLQTKWPLSFDGRFSGYDNKIRTIYIQPTVAYQILPWLSFGAGLDIVTGKIELDQRADLAVVGVPTSLGVPAGTLFGQFGIPPGTDFADVHLEATGTKVTSHWGVIVKVSDRLSFGGRYLMHAKIGYDGDATFAQVLTNLVIPATITVGPLTIPAGTPVDLFLTSPPLDVFNTALRDSTITGTITNPEQLVFGLAWKLRDDLTTFFDYQWVRWGKRFTRVFVDFANPATPDLNLHENYNNTNGFRFGAEWVKDAKLTFRGGYLYHTAGAPPETVTPLLPEGFRNEFTGGVGVKFSPKLTGDFAYQYIRQNDRRGRTRNPPGNAVPTAGNNNGLYTFAAHLFGVTFAYTF